MRLWSVHPRYLDRQGLTAAWREALLAQAVLTGRTRGYARHPQLDRFRAQPDPAAAIGAFLVGLHDEAGERGYRFDRAKILRAPDGADAPGAALVTGSLAVTRGQVALEWEHLLAKLAGRSPDHHARLADLSHPDPHPLFHEVPGPVAPWERRRPDRPPGG